MLGFIDRNTKHFKQTSNLKTLNCLLVRSSLDNLVLKLKNLSMYLKYLELMQYKYFKQNFISHKYNQINKYVRLFIDFI
jgi:hypothetical protein